MPLSLPPSGRGAVLICKPCCVAPVGSTASRAAAVPDFPGSTPRTPAPPHHSCLCPFVPRSQGAAPATAALPAETWQQEGACRPAALSTSEVQANPRHPALQRSPLCLQTVTASSSSPRPSVQAARVPLGVWDQRLCAQGCEARRWLRHFLLPALQSSFQSLPYRRLSGGRHTRQRRRRNSPATRSCSIQTCLNEIINLLKAGWEQRGYASSFHHAVWGAHFK